GIAWQGWRTVEALKQSQRHLYVSQIILADRYFFSDNQRDQAEKALDLCPDNLRGLEWRYLKRLCLRGRVVLRGHTGPVLGVQYSPDGKTIATASQDKTVKVWDPEKGKLLSTLRGHMAWVNSICFSDDGRRLITAGEDEQVIIWDVTT